MHPRNSMRTKTLSLEEMIFRLKFGENGSGTKARSRSQRRVGPGTKATNVPTRNNVVYSLFDFCQLVYHFLSCWLASTRAISSPCTPAHMPARLTWDPSCHLTKSKHRCKHLLWVLRFSPMPFLVGFDDLWVHMSQYWNIGPFSHFSCAPRIEAFKMLFQCFDPEPFTYDFRSCFCPKFEKSAKGGFLQR